MQIEPQAPAFAKRYARGRPGRLDHARFRSRNAGVGLPQDRRRRCELSPGIGRRRRCARALFDHRARSRSGLAHGQRQRRDQSQGRPRRTASRPATRHRSGAARVHRRSRISCRSRCRRWRQAFRLPRLRHGAADGGIAAAQSRPDRHPRRRICAHHRGRVRRGEDTITVVAPVRPGEVSADTAFAGGRSPLGHRRCARSTARAFSPSVSGPRYGVASSNTTPAEYDGWSMPPEYIAAGDVSGRAIAAVQAPFELPPFSLYRALRRVSQRPSSTSSISTVSPLPDRSGNPGTGARGHRHHPAACRHAGRTTPSGTRRSKPSSWPTRTRRASDAARSRPQRRRPGFAASPPSR